MKHQTPKYEDPYACFSYNHKLAMVLIKKNNNKFIPLRKFIFFHLELQYTPQKVLKLVRMIIFTTFRKKPSGNDGEHLQLPMP